MNFFLRFSVPAKLVTLTVFRFQSCLHLDLNHNICAGISQLQRREQVLKPSEIAEKNARNIEHAICLSMEFK